MESLKVIKIGGNVVDNPVALDQFLKEFAGIDGYKILVHGGGKIASTIGRELGVEPKMVDGRRVTNLQTLRVVTMVYGGLINKSIVATLQAFGCNAIGMTGADGALILSDRRAAMPVDFGEVGDPRVVNSSLLALLLKGGFIPVIAPLTLSDSGGLLNTNADTVAQSVATAMVSSFGVELCYRFEMSGVMDNAGALIEHIDEALFVRLRENGTVSGGMIPKIENALAAVAQGVRMVKIGATAIK